MVELIRSKPGVAAALAALLLSAGCPGLAPGPAGSGDAGPGTLGLISAAELHAALAAKDFLLIDVHTPRAGVVPGTDTRIAFSDVDGLARYIGPDLDRKVVLTCLSGGMSSTAGNALAGRGYRAVRHLEGGMNAWTAAGYALDP